MQGALVSPLDDSWRETLDGVARARGWPTTQEPARLSREVARLSAAYNEGFAGHAPLPARLAFSFVRDVPKTAGAVRELVGTGILHGAEGRPLRVLDLGAGLGASTWGLARALESAGVAVPIEATWVDDDGEALDVALSILRARSGADRSPPIHARTHLRGLERVLDGNQGRFDVILLGQVLSELSPGSHDRVARHTALIGALLDRALQPEGAIVIVEPALRDRTRHLHAVRDALLGSGMATVFAPCLHQKPCPALAHPRDWCHEDLEVDLPAWLVPIARGAGLRWQGLTFSYLVLRRDGRSLSDFVRAGARRVVSMPRLTKGKAEVFLCGGADGGWVRATRLDRDASDVNHAWVELRRGDLVTVDPALETAHPRIRKGARVEVAEPGRTVRR